VARYAGDSPKERAGRALQHRAPPAGSPFAKLLALRAEMLGLPEAPSPSPQAFAEGLLDAPHETFQFGSDGTITAEGRVLARLTPGVDLLRPDVLLTLEPPLAAGLHRQLHRRLLAVARDMATEALGPWWASGSLASSEALRALGYLLGRGLGTVRRSEADSALSLLTESERSGLTGLLIGRRFVALREALHPSRIERRALLVAVAGRPMDLGSLAGAPSLRRAKGVHASAYLRLGYAPVGPRALRVDLLERFLEELSDPATRRSALDSPQLHQRFGCTQGELPALLFALDPALRPRRSGPRSPTRPHNRAPTPRPRSPRATQS